MFTLFLFRPVIFHPSRFSTFGLWEQCSQHSRSGWTIQVESFFQVTIFFRQEFFLVRCQIELANGLFFRFFRAGISGILPRDLMEHFLKMEWEFLCENPGELQQLACHITIPYTNIFIYSPLGECYSLFLRVFHVGRKKIATNASIVRVLLSWLWRVTDWHSCALFRNVAASKWLALAWVFFGGCWRNKGEMDYKRIVSKFPKFLYGKNFRAQFNPASSSSPARKIFLQGTFSIRWERESQKFERNFDSKMPLQAQPHPVYKEDFRVGNFLELLTGSLKLALALRLPSVVHVSHGHALLTTHSENLPPNIPLWLNQGSCVFTFLHSITFLRENISTLGGERYPLQNGNS